MDPISALILLGTGAAVAASSAEQLKAQRRTMKLQGALGMAMEPSTPPAAPQGDVSTEYLPNELPSFDVWNLWEIFGYPAIRVDVDTQLLEWPSNRSDFDSMFLERGVHPRGTSVGTWRSPDVEGPSLWDAIHRAWLGITPPLILDMSYSRDGQYLGGEIEVRTGQAEIDLHVLGPEISSLAQGEMESWLEPDEAEIVGHSFVECFQDRIHGEIDVHSNSVLLGEIEDVICSDLFTEMMAEISEKFDDLDGDVGSGDDKFQAEINQISRDCAQDAHQEWEDHQENYYEDEDDEDEDEWDEE